MNASEEMLDRTERTAGRLRKELADANKRIAELEDAARARSERELQKGIYITTEQIDELWSELHCRCDACWTDRDLHSPDCHEDTLEIIGIVACEECGGSGVMPRGGDQGTTRYACASCQGHGWVKE